MEQSARSGKKKMSRGGDGGHAGGGIGAGGARKLPIEEVRGRVFYSNRERE